MKHSDRPMQNVQHKADVLIVGAGMIGLTAASELQQKGHNVIIFDKGRGAGGRLASRHIGLATFDHGAQFMTGRDPRFAEPPLTNGAELGWWRNGIGAPRKEPRDIPAGVASQQ